MCCINRSRAQKEELYKTLFPFPGRVSIGTLPTLLRSVFKLLYCRSIETDKDYLIPVCVIDPFCK